MVSLQSKLKSPSWITFGIIILLFFFKEISYIQVFGFEPLGNADGFSEANSRDGASLFIKEGFSKNAFLPTYPHLEIETPVEAIAKSHIYTHYFPGPDYVMTFFFSVFGDRQPVFQWMRLFPLFQILISVILFSIVAEKAACRNWEWSKVWIAALLFSAPAMTQWVINLHGHAYSTSSVFALMTLGMLAVTDSDQTSKRKWGMRVFAFFLGIYSIYMLMTGVFITAAAPLVGGLLVSNAQNRKEAWALSFSAGLGLIAGFLIHYYQIALALGWEAAYQDQIATALLRGHASGGKPDRIMLIGQYSDHVWRFFRVSALFMLFSGWFFTWLHHSKNFQKRSVALALLFATLAGYAWIMSMKKHAIDHPHVNPRIFFLLFAAWSTVIVSLAADHLEFKKSNQIG